MADESTTEQVIENSQEDMNDFVSFEDADHSVEEKAPEETEEVKEETKEAKPSETEEISEEKVDFEKKEVSETIEAKKEEESSETKLLKILDGDKATEIKMDAKVSMKIDGKDVEMTMQEVINAASGNQAVDKRFSELSVDKNQFQVERSAFNVERDDLVGKIGQFSDAVKNNDAVGAITALAVLSGSNPVELRTNFKNLLLEQAKAYVEMTPEKQQAFDKEQEIEYHRQESDSLRSQNEAHNSSQELETSLLRFQAKNGVNDAALVALYDEAEAKSVELNSAEDFERFHSEQLIQTRSSTLLSSVDPSLSDDKEALSVVSDFINKNPDMSDEDVKDIIKKTLDDDDEPSAEEKSLNSKIKDKQKKNLKGKQSDNSETPIVDDDDEMLSFDDLDY